MTSVLTLRPSGTDSTIFSARTVSPFSSCWASGNSLSETSRPSGRRQEITSKSCSGQAARRPQALDDTPRLAVERHWSAALRQTRRRWPAMNTVDAGAETSLPGVRQRLAAGPRVLMPIKAQRTCPRYDSPAGSDGGSAQARRMPRWLPDRDARPAGPDQLVHPSGRWPPHRREDPNARIVGAQAEATMDELMGRLVELSPEKGSTLEVQVRFARNGATGASLQQFTFMVDGFGQAADLERRRAPQATPAHHGARQARRLSPQRGRRRDLRRPDRPTQAAASRPAERSSRSREAGLQDGAGQHGQNGVQQGRDQRAAPDRSRPAFPRGIRQGRGPPPGRNGDVLSRCPRTRTPARCRPFYSSTRPSSWDAGTLRRQV